MSANCISCATQDRPVQRVATSTVWCPTWVTAYQGPINLCEQHRATFDPSLNEYAAGGSFHFGNAAHIAFESVELAVLRDDPGYQDAKAMVERGTILNGEHIGLLNWIVSEVDGKAWLGTYRHISCLGPTAQARQLFPMLFE